MTAPAQKDDDVVSVDAVADQSASIGQRMGRGLRWSIVGAMTIKVGSFAMALVLARLLSQRDFGIYAVAMAANFFLMHVNDLGLIAATVQWRGKLEEIAPTATTIAAAFSVFVFGAFWFAAPAFTSLAGAPDAVGVVRLLSVTIVIDGITAVRVASILRNFQQDKLTIANGVGFVANACTAISLAASGAGPYSFVGGLVVGSTVTGALILFWAKVPARAGFNRKIARSLLAYGIPLAIGLGVESVLLNTDYVVVGHVAGEVALGLYLLAFNVSSWVPGLVGTAVRYVTVPGFSRLSERDTERLSNGVARSVTMMYTALVPITMLLATLPLPLIVFLFGARWAPAAVALSFLAILMTVRMLTSLVTDVVIGVGKTRLPLLLNICWAVALVPALIIGARLDGIRGVAMAHAIVGIMVAIPVAAYALRRVGVRLRPIATGLIRPTLGGALGVVVSLVVARSVGSQPIVQLLAAGVSSCAVYALTALSGEQRRQWLALARPHRAATAPVDPAPAAVEATAEPATATAEPAPAVAEAAPHQPRHAR